MQMGKRTKSSFQDLHLIHAILSTGRCHGKVRRAHQSFCVLLTSHVVTVVISQGLFTWISVTGALSIAPMFPLLGKEFHLNNNQLAMLTGITVITLGFANFFIVPLSNIFGRRAISLVFSVLIMLSCVWQALATSHRSLLAARAINGLVCATSETIPVQMIADVFFLHERGLWTGVYL